MEEDTFDMPPPGFRALDPIKPVRIYRGQLPHWRQEGATYFITFRLGDSLPQRRLDELKEEREIWSRRHPDPSDNELHERWRKEMAKIERWLDQGHGECVLAQGMAARIVEDAIGHFDGDRYALCARIVMPNHCHVVLRPHRGHELEDSIASWKKFTARQINAVANRDGRLWQREYYDHIVRDTPELRRVLRYLEKNERQIKGRRQVWVTSKWREWLNGGRAL